MQGEEEVIEGKLDWKGRPARRGKHGGPYTALLILATNAFENMASFANAANLVTYFNIVMHYNIADAANVLTNYMGTGFMLAIGVAFLADSFFGRYRTALAASFIEFLGFVMLTVQAHYARLKPPPCNIFNPLDRCVKLDGGQAALLFCSLYLIALGSSGLKACLPSLIADQFEEKDPIEAKHMSSFFNWILLSLCVGASISLTFIVWIQNNKGWDVGFGISTILMLVTTVVFSIGIPRYRIQTMQKANPIIEIVQVFVASFRNRKHQLPENTAELYELEWDKESTMDVEFLPHRDIFRFLDKAAVPPMRFQSGSPMHDLPSPWKLCRVTQVENAKNLLGVFPIFLCTITMSTCLSQLQTFSVQQGLTMNTRIVNHLHLPPASLPIIPIAFMLFLIPTYDRLIVPFIRRFTGHPTGITYLQRIGCGLVLSAIAMGTAALVEVKRKNVARGRGMIDALPGIQPLPITVFWLSFQFFIFGVADVFTYAGLLEFFHSEAPKSMKSISTSFFWTSTALGYFLSTVLVQIVNHVTKGLTKSKGWLAGNNLNRNHLDLFYWLLFMLSFLNFLHYLFWARWYKYRPQAVLEVQPDRDEQDELKQDF